MDYRYLRFGTLAVSLVALLQLVAKPGSLALVMAVTPSVVRMSAVFLACSIAIALAVMAVRGVLGVRSQ